MNEINRPSLFERLQFVLLVALMLALFAPRASAQPYFTNNNSGTFFGAQQYNQSLPLSYNPSYVIQRQLNEGIMSTTFTPGGAYSYYTNTWQGIFGNYTNYSVPPALFIQALNPAGGPSATINQTNVVLFVTTTNFAVYFGNSTNLTFSLLTVGH